MDDADARDLLLARRLKLGIRLVVYPLLLGLLAVAWHARSARGEADTAPVQAQVWREQAPGLVRPAVAVTSEGRLRSVSGVVLLPCGDGSPFTLRWAFGGGFIQKGAAVIADRDVPDEHAGDGGAMSTVTHLEANVSASELRVTLSAAVVWTRADNGRVVRCERAPQRFTLRPSS